MGILLKQLFSLIRLLNSDTGHKSIAAGITCGFILGMTPNFSLQSAFIFVCLFIFRIQIGAAFVAAFFFSFIAWALDPVFHSVGSTILEANSLQSLFVNLYNQPIIPFTRFYNSIVMGSGAVSFLLAPIIYVASIVLIKKYRATILERFKQTKLWKAFKLSVVYQWYRKYESLYG